MKTAFAASGYTWGDPSFRYTPADILCAAILKTSSRFELTSCLKIVRTPFFFSFPSLQFTSKTNIFSANFHSVSVMWRKTSLLEVDGRLFFV